VSASVLPSQTAVTAPAAPAQAGQAAAANATAAGQPVPAARAAIEAPAPSAAALEASASVTGKAPTDPAGVTTSAPIGTVPAVAADESRAGEAASPGRTSPAQAAWLGKNGGPLAERAIGFNRYPQRYAHPSWIPETWGPWMGKLPAGSKSEASLGRGLLRHWGLAETPCFDFTTPARRLALIEGEPLRRTLLLAGVARHADAIARLMERSKVKELKEQVGEDAYKFAMFRAPLLAGPLAAGGNEAAPAGADWKTRCMAAGMGMFGACLAGGPAGLSARAVLKFPREYAPYFGAGGGEGTQEGYLRLFRRILAQEVDPAWDSLLS
jgi:hypothetical protein